MNRRILALLLAACMMLALLAGCGSKEEAPAEEPEAVVEDAPVEEPAPAEDAVVEAPSTDLEDVVADDEVVDTRTEIELPLTEEEVHYTFFLSQPGGAAGNYVDSYSEYPHWQKSFELTNVYIDFDETDGMTSSEKFNLMIASGEYTDFIAGTGNFTSGADYAIEEEIVIDLTDLIAEYAPNYNYYRTQTKFLDAATKTVGGNIASFYELFSDFLGPFFGAFIRQDWLDDLGLEKPETYDEYHDVLMAFKTEKGATKPIMMESTLVGNDNFFVGGYGITSTFGSANAKESYWYVNDGVVKCGLVADEYYDYLCMLRDWVQEGLISKDFPSEAGAMASAGMAEICNDKVGVFFNGAPMMSMYSRNAVDPDFRIVAGYDPVHEKGEKVHVDTTEYDFGGERVAITTACENPELAVQYWDFWFTEQGINLANYGVEGLTCEIGEDGKPHFTEMVTNNPDIAAGDAISIYTGRNSTPTWASNSKLLVSFNEDEAAAFEIWASCRDNRDAYPVVAMLTADEIETYASHSTEYETFCDETRSLFVTGEKELNEQTWQEYIDVMYELGIQENIDLKQAAYDRYMAQ